MTKQHEHVTIFKKYDKLLFFVIYDQIMSNLHALSNHV